MSRALALRSQHRHHPPPQPLEWWTLCRKGGFGNALQKRLPSSPNHGPHGSLSFWPSAAPRVMSSTRRNPPIHGPSFGTRGSSLGGGAVRPQTSSWSPSLPYSSPAPWSLSAKLLNISWISGALPLLRTAVYIWQTCAPCRCGGDGSCTRLRAGRPRADSGWGTRRMCSPPGHWRWAEPCSSPT